MQIQTSNLPQELQQQLHPEFLANERCYLQMRAQLLSPYRGRWVAVADGKVLAAGVKLMEVMEMASTVAEHPFIALVGEEDTTVFRVRHAVFAYDQGYKPFPLPRVAATFWNHAQTHSQAHMNVIPDTGADISVLPSTDCAMIDLFNSPCMSGIAGGVVGATITTVFYRAKVEMNGQKYAALIQPVRGSQERIVGRDAQPTAIAFRRTRGAGGNRSLRKRPSQAELASPIGNRHNHRGHRQTAQVSCPRSTQ